MRTGWIEAQITVPSVGWTIDCVDSVGSFQVELVAGNYSYAAQDTVEVSDPFLPGIILEFNRLSAAAGHNLQFVFNTDAGVADGTLKCTATSTCEISWDDESDDFRGICGYSGNITAKDQLSDVNSTAYWYPDCALQSHDAAGEDLEMDNYKGWSELSAPATESRRGDLRVIAYQRRFVRDFIWPAVSANKTWIANETTTHESFERFYRNVILGEASWARPGGPIIWNTQKGGIANYGDYRWAVEGHTTAEIAQMVEQWTGRWLVRLPRCVLAPALNDHGMW